MIEKNKTKQNRKVGSKYSAKRMRPFISGSWEEIDAILDNLRTACRGNSSLLHEAIIKQIAIRFIQWGAVDAWRTLRPSYKERPHNSRKGDASKRRNVVSRPTLKKTANGKNKSSILRGNKTTIMGGDSYSGPTEVTLESYLATKKGI